MGCNNFFSNLKTKGNKKQRKFPVNINRKLKNKEKECPYCGIDIKDYLYNN